MRTEERDKINAAYASLRGAAASSPRTREVNKAYGGLTAFAHVAGYTFERAMTILEWLLEDDRWREVGYGNVNAFLDSLQLGNLRLLAEQRRHIAKRIKELTSEKASNRSIARALGVSHQTVYDDLSVKKLTAKPQKTQSTQCNGGPNAEHVACPACGHIFHPHR